MQPLITRNEIAKYRQISKTPNDAKLNEMILDAQILDLQPLIGETLHNKIMASPQDYEELLEGDIYETDGIGYTNYGLKNGAGILRLCQIHHVFISNRHSVLGSGKIDSRQPSG